ncbi:MltA domain-containing protein [Jannaschia sp. LMIT008]|uniref:MltA domain-containing protein n=1 Tax=Jannaschia maritima TaxID=3032585 RepID=UPI0028120312|nr:MltA domain-containing protein [Jannaschia sp. LMIT008]
MCAATAVHAPSDLDGWDGTDPWIDRLPPGIRPERTVVVHVTGYYEPELRGARRRSDAYPVPIHAVPPGGITASRAAIEDGDLLAGRELLWLRDPVDRFVLQVQGSGRIALEDGSDLRVGYAGRNGHPYVSLGRLLIEAGHLDADTITARAVAGWLRAQPDGGRATMRRNPSYVMFRLLDTDPALGPIGTAGVPLTSLRSIAIDPAHVPLGSLVWLSIDGPDPIRRICVAQDTGSAITGPGRIDLFCGTGDAAGDRAGRLNARGRMTILARP